MAASDKEEILEKIENGQVSVNGKRVKPKPKPELKKEEAKEAEPSKPKPVQEEKVQASKEPKAPKVSEFPTKGTINKYGFIGISVSLVTALGLPLKAEGAKGKLAANVPIEFSAYNLETKELTIKIF